MNHENNNQEDFINQVTQNHSPSPRKPVAKKTKAENDEEKDQPRIDVFFPKKKQEDDNLMMKNFEKEEDFEVNKKMYYDLCGRVSTLERMLDTTIEVTRSLNNRLRDKNDILGPDTTWYVNNLELETCRRSRDDGDY